MRGRSKTAEAPVVPVDVPVVCEACGATTALETALIAPGWIAPCCKNPVACRERADARGIWKTYP